MKKFSSVVEYNKYLKNEFEMGMSKFAMSDFNEFVGEDDYEILVVIEEDDFDDNVLKVNGVCYWMVERYEGMRFVEIDNEEVEYFGW